MLLFMTTSVNGESFTGLNFCSFHGLSEKCESLSYESFAQSINIYWSLTVLQKYCRENPYTVDTMKVSPFTV